MSRRLIAGLGFFCWATFGLTATALAGEDRGKWQNFGACLLLDMDACEEWLMSETVELRKMYYLQQLRSNVASEEYDVALEYINAFIDADPEDPMGYYRRAMFLGLQRDYPAAKEDLSIAIGMAPDNSDFYVTRGVLNNKLGFKQEALDDLDRAIALGTDEFDAFYFRAAALNGLGRFEETLEAIKFAIQKQPDESYLYLDLSAAYADLEQYDQSLAILDHIHERWPDYASAYNHHCWTLAKFLGQYEKALPHCERALELAPDDSAAVHSRGYVFLELGQKAEAVSDFQRAAELGNDSDFVRDDLARALALPD